MIIFFVIFLLYICQIFPFNNGYSIITIHYYSHNMNSKMVCHSKKTSKQNLLTLTARCTEFDLKKIHRLNPIQSKKYYKFNIQNYFRYAILVSNKMHEKNQHDQAHDQASSLSINKQSSNNSYARDLYDLPTEELGKFNLFDTMCDDSEHRKQCEILSDEFSPIHDFDIFME